MGCSLLGCFRFLCMTTPPETDDPWDTLHQGRAHGLIIALFSRPEVLADDAAGVTASPRISDNNRRRLASSAVDQILGVPPLATETFFLDALADFDQDAKICRSLSWESSCDGAALGAFLGYGACCHAGAPAPGHLWPAGRYPTGTCRSLVWRC